MQLINIAIDGPSGSGKGTTAKLLAEKLDYNFLDTGSMYRAVALYLTQKGITTQTFSKKDLENISLSFNSNNEIELNGVSVESQIRTPEISQVASDFSTLKEVREFLGEEQKTIVKKKGFIAEGRDIGTVIMPEAEIKIYLTASVEARAQRRLEDFRKKGILHTFDEVVKQIEERDHQDMTRDIAPLIKAENAIEVDTSNLTIEQQVEAIYSLSQKIINN